LPGRGEHFVCQFVGLHIVTKDRISGMGMNSQADASSGSRRIQAQGVRPKAKGKR